MAETKKVGIFDIEPGDVINGREVRETYIFTDGRMIQIEFTKGGRDWFHRGESIAVDRVEGIASRTARFTIASALPEVAAIIRERVARRDFSAEAQIEYSLINVLTRFDDKSGDDPVICVYVKGNFGRQAAFFIKKYEIAPGVLAEAGQKPEDSHGMDRRLP